MRTRQLDCRLSPAVDLMEFRRYFREYRCPMMRRKARHAADVHDFDYRRPLRDPAPTLGRLFPFLGRQRGRWVRAPRPTGRALTAASVWQLRGPL